MLCELAVDNIGTYVDVITQIDAEQQYRMWFRGQSDYSWGLVPSVQRKDGMGKNYEQYPPIPSLFCMDFLSAGQCATGNGGPFVLDAAVARGGSTSNADRWICDFYDTTGGRRRGGTSGTGGSNASAGMVHIK